MTGSELFKFLDLVKEFEQKAKDLKERGEEGAGAKAHIYEDPAKKVNDLLHVLNP